MEGFGASSLRSGHGLRRPRGRLVRSEKVIESSTPHVTAWDIIIRDSLLQIAWPMSLSTDGSQSHSRFVRNRLIFPAKMPSCVVKGCKNSSGKGFLMKKFPKNPDRRASWAANVKREGWTPNNHSVLCEEHFGEDCWKIQKGRKTKYLNDDAIPTVFTCGEPVNKRMRKVEELMEIVDNTELVAPMDLGPVTQEIALSCIQMYHTYAKHYCEDKEERVEQKGMNNAISIAEKDTLPTDHTIVERYGTFLEGTGVEKETAADSDAQITDPASIRPSISQGRAKEDCATHSAGLTMSENSITFAESDQNPIATANTQSTWEMEQLRKHAEDLERKCSMQRLKINHLKNEVHSLNKDLKAAQDNNMRGSKIHKTFTKEQLSLLNGTITKVREWSIPALKTAFKIKFACGSTGYEELLKLNYPLPCIRTLTRHLQHIKFESGVLHEVIDRLAVKVKEMSEIEKDCILVLDEMAILAKSEYDISTGGFCGDVTFPGHFGFANHALVFMAAGTATRWKQTVSYYYTGDSIDGEVLSRLAIELVVLLEDIDLNVHVMTSDMGNCNQGMWKELGVKCTRRNIINYIVHPVDEERKLWILPDVCHLYKNIRSCLVNNKVISIGDMSEKNNLPCDEVRLAHIEQLCEEQNDLQLKPAPKLSSSLLQSGHFDKMKVSVAHKTLNRNVASALELMVEENICDESVLTTAWFLRTVHKWFGLMTSRHPVLALRKEKKEYQETIKFLEDVIKLFQNIKFGEEKKATWKPIQTGVILATRSMIEIQHFFLFERKYDFFLTSRLSQDCLENLFSYIRIRQPLPSALQFKRNLKLITVAQYMRNTSSSSYEEDDREFLGEFFKESSTRLAADFEDEDEEIKKLLTLMPDCRVPINNIESNSLYDLCGYIVLTIKNQQTICNKCMDAVLLKPDDDTKDLPNGLLKAKEYKENSLISVNNKCFSMLKTVEEIFRGLTHMFPDMKNVNDVVLTTVSEKVKGIHFPECHNIKEKILKRFVSCRLRIFSNQQVNADANTVEMGSKSVCMRALANNVTSGNN